MTAKQLLVAHLREHHRRVSTDRRPFRELSSAHGSDHHGLGWALDHYHRHTGSAGDRPIGWCTGGDVVVGSR